MTRRWIKAVLALPVMVLIVIPAAIVLVARPGPLVHLRAEPVSARFWAGIAVGGAGLALSLWTMILFMRFGKGTAAPWDPTHHLIVRGPYRHVRNPMISGVIAMLLAESLILGSWPILAWCGLFTLANAIYMPLVEERGLLERFGDAYTEYARHVPRWIPRPTPWSPDPKRS